MRTAFFSVVSLLLVVLDLCALHTPTSSPSPWVSSSSSSIVVVGAAAARGRGKKDRWDPERFIDEDDYTKEELEAMERREKEDERNDNEEDDISLEETDDQQGGNHEDEEEEEEFVDGASADEESNDDDEEEDEEAKSRSGHQHHQLEDTLPTWLTRYYETGKVAPICCSSLVERSCACITEAIPEYQLPYSSRRLAEGAVELKANSVGGAKDGTPVKATVFSLRYKEHPSKMKTKYNPSGMNSSQLSNYTHKWEDDPSLHYLLQDLYFEVDIQTFHPPIPGTDDDFIPTDFCAGGAHGPDAQNCEMRTAPIRTNITTEALRRSRVRNTILGSGYPKLMVRSDVLTTPFQAVARRGGQFDRFSSNSQSLTKPAPNVKEDPELFAPDQEEDPLFVPFDSEEMGWNQRASTKSANPDVLHRATLRFQLDEKQVRRQPVLFVLLWRDDEADRARSDSNPSGLGWSWLRQQEINKQEEEEEEELQTDPLNGYLHWRYRAPAEVDVRVPVAKWAAPLHKATEETPRHTYWAKSRAINVLLNGTTYLKLLEHKSKKKKTSGSSSGSSPTGDEEEAGTQGRESTRSFFVEWYKTISYQLRHLRFTISSTLGVTVGQVILTVLVSGGLYWLLKSVSQESKETLQYRVRDWKEGTLSFLDWFLRDKTGFLPPRQQQQAAAKISPSTQTVTRADTFAGEPVVNSGASSQASAVPPHTINRDLGGVEVFSPTRVTRPQGTAAAPPTGSYDDGQATPPPALRLRGMAGPSNALRGGPAPTTAPSVGGGTKPSRIRRFNLSQEDSSDSSSAGASPELSFASRRPQGGGGGGGLFADSTAAHTRENIFSAGQHQDQRFQRQTLWGPGDTRWGRNRNDNEMNW